DLGEVGGAGGAGVAQRNDAGAELDEPAQLRLFGDDLGVVAGVGGGGRRLHQGVQVGGAADAAQFAGAFELGADGDGVGGVAAAVQVQDGLVDDLVGGPVEVLGAHRVGDLADRGGRQQHPAEHRLLGG